MAELHLEREFPVSAARLFEAISTRAEVTRWWGHDGWQMEDEALDLGREGPWHAAMRSKEGTLFHIAGQVTHVVPGRSIGFTWAWTSPQQMQGGTSHVTFTVTETAAGAKLVIDHRELPTDEMATSHAQGWAGPLGRLERYLRT